MKFMSFRSKWIGVLVSAALFGTLVLPAGATGLAQGTVSSGDTPDIEAQGDLPEDAQPSEPQESAEQSDPADAVEQSDLPDTIGMSVAEAEETLDAYGEVILTYRYSMDVEADIVMEQMAEEDRITLVVSLGREPDEELYQATMTATPMKVSKIGAFGISAYSDEEPIVIDGVFDDWNDFPVFYDFDWDHTGELWNSGIWVPGIEGSYKLPYGERDEVADNKFGFVVYGDYIYIHARRASAGGPNFPFADYWLYGENGERAAFDLHDLDGGSLTLGQGNAAPGIHEVSVFYVRTWPYTTTRVEGSKAILKVNDDLMNTELEMRIPLSALGEDWPLIAWENAQSLQFFQPVMMKNRMTASGAGTGPLAAVAALFGVPAGVTLIRRRGRRKVAKGEADE